MKDITIALVIVLVVFATGCATVPAPPPAPYANLETTSCADLLVVGEMAAAVADLPFFGALARNPTASITHEGQQYKVRAVASAIEERGCKSEGSRDLEESEEDSAANP